MKSTMKKLSVAAAAALFIAACGGSAASPSASAVALTGDISIDGCIGDVCLSRRSGMEYKAYSNNLQEVDRLLEYG